HDKSCEVFAEIGSYLYNETSAAERRRFESHLSNCDMCTDEFAAISNARFSIFEWQREEFANLPTPEFHIPYAVTRARAIQEKPKGFLSVFDKALSFGRLGWAIPVFGAVLLSMG